jgi:uncharacterized protein (TIGR02118 family)
MIKVTVLYGHPKDSNAFENYYSTTHSDIVSKMHGHEKLELTKFINNPDGSKPEYYRMAEFWYTSLEVMQKAMASPEGQASADDLSHFATGGVSIHLGEVM